MIAMTVGATFDSINPVSLLPVVGLVAYAVTAVMCAQARADGPRVS